MSDETPVSSEEALLLASLERPLNAAEIEQLLRAMERQPELADNAAMIGLLRELRLEHRIQTHQQTAWTAFQQMAAGSAGNRNGRQTAASTSTAQWQHWMRSLAERLRPLAPAFASLVIIMQSIGLGWLYYRPAASDAPLPTMRGGSAPVCPALLIQFRPDVSMNELSRVLTQSQMALIAGPDMAGYYRVSGPASLSADGQTLLRNLASDIKPAADCQSAH